MGVLLGARVCVERDVVGEVQKGKEEEVLGRYMVKEVCVCGDGGGGGGCQEEQPS